MEELNNNGEGIVLFFCYKAVITAKNGETKTVHQGECVVTKDEYIKFDLKAYKKITLSFMRQIKTSDTSGDKQIFEKNQKYSMPKYRFDRLKFSATQWGELTFDCVLENIYDLPFDVFNYLYSTALDRIGKIFFDNVYNNMVRLRPEVARATIQEESTKEAKKYEEETYTRIISQRPELIVFFNIRFLYEKLIIDKSQNIFKTSFQDYVDGIKELDLSYLYDHDFYKFFSNIREFDNSDKITGLKKKPNEILLDFIEFFFGGNPERSDLALICLCIDEMNSDYLTSEFFSGEQNAIQEIYDALFENGKLTESAKERFSNNVEYKHTYMPLHSGFFSCLISKLKYKPEYKDKFLELISFGGYKNYDGKYEIPDWKNQLELLRFIDPNFIRDNLDNNLVQEYLKNAISRREHEDYLKKIAEYSKDFNGNLKSEKDYLLKLVEFGCIEYVNTKFICDNIDNEIIKNKLSYIESIDKLKDLFNYFYELYNGKEKPEEIEAIDRNIGILMNHCRNIICNLDVKLIVNDLNKSYIRNNIYKIDSVDKQKAICADLYNQYQDPNIEQDEQKQTIIKNTLFLIQCEEWESCINYFDSNFIIELLLGDEKNSIIVINAFKDIYEEKAQELCVELCKKYEESAEEQKRKYEEYIIKLVKKFEYRNYYNPVADYLSGEFVLEHLTSEIIKGRGKGNLRLISKTCQDLCSKYSESQEGKKKYYKNVIINLLNSGYLHFIDLSVEFIVECVFEDKWLKKINEYADKEIKIRQLAEYLCDKYKNNEIDKNDCTNKIFQLIKVNSKSICYLSVEFIAENFDTEVIESHLNKIDFPDKQKELYNYFYDKYNEAKNKGNKELENVNRDHIIKLINACEEVLVNGDVDIKFIFENKSDIAKPAKKLNNKHKQELLDRMKTYTEELYFLGENNKPDFEKQEQNKNEVLNWIKKLNNLINFVSPKFIAENLQNEQILDCIKNINAENLNSLYNCICENYDGEEKKNKILVLIDKQKSNDCFMSERFLYDNFDEKAVKEYISQRVKDTNARKTLWNMLYECYSNDENKSKGKQKLLAFIETCSKKIEFWDGYKEIDTQFICDCFGEEIVREEVLDRLAFHVKHDYDGAEEKMLYILGHVCNAQKEYESTKTGEDRTKDILKSIDEFCDVIQYVSVEFIYKNFDTKEVKNKLRYITKSQIKQLVDCINKNPKEDDIEQYFLTLISAINIFEDYIDMKWIYEHLDNQIIKGRLSFIHKKEYIKELYDCIVTSEKEDEQKKQDILTVVDSYKDNTKRLINFLCIMDAGFVLDNIDDEKIKEMIKLCLSSNDDFYSDTDYLAQKFALRKLICAIELVQDKSEQEKLYLKLLNTLNNSANVFRYTSVKFLEDCVDSENQAIKEYIAQNISVKTYKYKYKCGENAETIEKSKDIKKDNKFVKCLFSDISNNNEENNKFLEEALKYIRAYKISDLSLLAKICGDMLTDPEMWDTFTKFIDECKTYDSSFFDKLLKKTAPDKDLALKLIDSKYFLDEKDKQSCLKFFSRVLKCGMLTNLEMWDTSTKFIDECKTDDLSFFDKLLKKTAPDKNLALKLINSKYFLDEKDKQSCLDFFSRVLKSVDKYDDDYYKNFVCKLIDLDSKFVTKYINKKFLADNCESAELKKLVNPKEKDFALNKDDAEKMFTHLDPEKERDKKIILELINLGDFFCRYVSDKFLIENWDNKNIQDEISRRIEYSGNVYGNNKLFDFLHVIEERTDLDAEGKKQASLKLLSFDKSCNKLIDDKRNLDFVINNIECKEIQVQLKTYLQGENGYTDYKKDILSYIKGKTQEDGWDEKRKENAILILISCSYAYAICYFDIKFLMSHDEGRAAIKDQVFNSKFDKREDNIFNRVLKYLKRKTEKDGWSDKQKKDFISDLILNGGKKDYRSESIAFNLKNPIIQDFMKDHLNPDDDIFKSLIDYLNKNYVSPNYSNQNDRDRQIKYFEDRILYLISLQPEFVIDYVHPNFLFNNRQKDLVKSGLKKYEYNGDNYCDFVLSLISCNPNLIKKPSFYVEFIFDQINGLFWSMVKKFLCNYFDNNKDDGYSLFVELENQSYSSFYKDLVRNRLLKLVSSNPECVIEWMISDKDNHYDENAKFLVDCLDDSDVDNESKSDILKGLVMLCTKDKNYNGIQKIFNKLTNRILNLISLNLDYSLAGLKSILCDKKNSAFLQKYLVYINQLKESEDKNKILELLKEWNINLEIQIASVNKNNLGEKENGSGTDVKLINTNIDKKDNSDMKKKIQESMENINSAQNLNLEINSNTDKNSEGEKAENEKNSIVDKNNLKLENDTGNEKTGDPINNTNESSTETEKIKTEPLSIILNHINDMNPETQKPIERDKNIINSGENPPTLTLFKTKVSHNLLKIAIGLIVLSILFGATGFAAKTPILYIISVVILFIGLVTLLAWSVKKCRKQNNDIGKIDMMQDNDPEENKEQENIRSSARSNEYEINTNSPTQISQSDVKQ